MQGAGGLCYTVAHLHHRHATRHPPTPALDMQTSRTDRRLTLHAHNSAGAPVWLFDLDNTLHAASSAIFPRINRLMTDYVERIANTDRAGADALRVEYTRRYGATLLGLLRHHAVDPHHFLHEVHVLGDLMASVHTERSLAGILRALPGRKIILTNGPEAYARGILRALGIERLFEQVIAIEQMQGGRAWRAKPDLNMLRQVLRRASVNPTQAILVEDTRGHLKSYKRLGLRTVWMVGHLPEVRRANAQQIVRGTGRPHYVDYRIRSLKSLHRISPRRNPCGNPAQTKTRP